MTERNPIPGSLLTDLMLDTLLDSLRGTLQGDLSVPEDRAETAATVLGLFSAMVAQAEALNVLDNTEFAEAGAANRRSIFEAWVQIRYLLRCLTIADRRAAGIKCRLFALIEFRDFVVSRDPDPEDLRTLDNRLIAMRVAEPDLFAEVEALRAGQLGGSRFYWTGFGPPALIREVQKTVDPSTDLAALYKFESWEAHHVMGPLLDVSISREGAEPQIQFGPRQAQADASAFSLAVASYMLIDGWRLLEAELQLVARVPPTADWDTF